MKSVEVTWQDAGCERENLDFEQASKLHPVTRKNLGYLICDDDERVIICFGIIDDCDKKMSCTSDTLVIPKGDVQELKVMVEV